MKPLIERLKAERQELIVKVGDVTKDVRHFRMALEGMSADAPGRSNTARRYAQASHSLFRLHARLTELKNEISTEHVRLDAAVSEARAAARRAARSGSTSTPKE